MADHALTPGELENHASIATTISSPQLIAYGRDAVLNVARESVIALHREARRAREIAAREAIIGAGMAIAFRADATEAIVAVLAEKLTEIKGVRVTWDEAGALLDACGPKPAADDAEVSDPGDEDDGS